ncbi:hypothetical protein PGTUg99_025088 [Puccinia graminis f. sp. tritici]|uniref:Uncharacterized protein n=1 Tax=Puccinia graminis f. sp. tritici TaxID=56615 RepID=A0A5B0RNJ4_PUCGR|nr:hypothetical protein PGTUg99_025088 [Puccinia graminis f. sp. tritici]
MWRKRRSPIMIGVVRSILLTSLVSMVHVVEVNGQAEPFDQRVPATTTTGYPSDSSPTNPSPRYPAPIINDPTAPNYGLNSSFPAGSTLNPTNIPGTASGVTSSPTTNSSAIPHPPLDPNSSSSSSKPPANQNTPPPLPGASSPNNINPNNAAASVDNHQQTQTIGGGLKPEILMAVVLAGCQSAVLLSLSSIKNRVFTMLIIYFLFTKKKKQTNKQTLIQFVNKHRSWVSRPDPGWIVPLESVCPAPTPSRKR